MTEELEEFTPESFALDPAGVHGKGTINMLSYSAKMFAKSTLVPREFRNNPANCYLALDFATRMKLPVLSVMRGMYVTPQGGMGFSAEFYLSRLRMTEAVLGTPRYLVHKISDEMLDGGNGSVVPDIAVRATVIDATAVDEDGDPLLVSEEISMRQAIANGWTRRGKDGRMPNKYEGMGVQMLKKRAIVWLIRNHFPEVMMGLPERDEMDDIRNVEAATLRDDEEAGMDRLRTAPQARVVEAEDAKPTFEDAEVGSFEYDTQPDPDPGGLTEEQADAILDWTLVEGMNAKDILATVKDAFHRQSIDGLTEEEASELLRMINAGDFGDPT